MLWLWGAGGNGSWPGVDMNIRKEQLEQANNIHVLEAGRQGRWWLILLFYTQVLEKRKGQYGPMRDSEREEGRENLARKGGE